MMFCMKFKIIDEKALILGVQREELHVLGDVGYLKVKKVII